MNDQPPNEATVDEPDQPIGRRSFDHWFGEKGRNGFIHRSWMKSQGFSEEAFDGRR